MERSGIVRSGNNAKKLDPIAIHHIIIDSWWIYALFSFISLLYVYSFPQLLPDKWGISILSGGIAITPLVFATFIVWVIEERWKKNN